MFTLYVKNKKHYTLNNLKIRNIKCKMKMKRLEIAYKYLFVLKMIKVLLRKEAFIHE